MSREEKFIRIYCEITRLPESSARCAFLMHDALGARTGGQHSYAVPPAMSERSVGLERDGARIREGALRGNGAARRESAEGFFGGGATAATA
jgi:hypothetical protein